MGEHTLGNAGYTITGSGGGGSDGQYVFASLTELDDIIAQWTDVHRAIRHDSNMLVQAQGIVHAPADDEMSTKQAAAKMASLDKALLHNDSLREYAGNYIKKLRATREQYLADDERAAIQLRSADAH